MDERVRQQLAALHDRIEPLLHRMSQALPPGCRLTLVARHTELARAEIILTEDSIPNVVETLQRHAACQGGAEAAVAEPGCIADRNARQATVAAWGVRSFGRAVMESAAERGARLLEEALEFAQAVGVPQDKAAHILGQVYVNPPGDPAQEAGGVGVTLLAACSSLGLSADRCEQAEVDRVLAKPVEHFARRHAEKEAAGMMMVTRELGR